MCNPEFKRSGKMGTHTANHDPGGAINRKRKKERKKAVAGSPRRSVPDAVFLTELTWIRPRLSHPRLRTPALPHPRIDQNLGCCLISPQRSRADVYNDPLVLQVFTKLRVSARRCPGWGQQPCAGKRGGPITEWGWGRPATEEKQTNP